MELHIFPQKKAMAEAAAQQAASLISEAINRRGDANLILATGASQFEMLEHLVTLDVDWSRVTGYHLDEYIGLSEAHPASFRRYLRERFVEPARDLRAFHFVNGENPDPWMECARLGRLLQGCRVDVACIGIGENGHLAFNCVEGDIEFCRDRFLLFTFYLVHHEYLPTFLRQCLNGFLYYGLNIGFGKDLFIKRLQRLQLHL